MAPLVKERAIRALFDTAWYLDQNPDVAQAGLDPLQHYLEQGAWELRNPNPLFDSDWYLETNPGIGELNPLVHYVASGAARDPHPLFDSRLYVETHGAPTPGMTPLEDFLAGDRQSCAGVYPSLAALNQIQQNFLGRVAVELVADRRASKVPWAVFLQCGQGSLHPRWLTDSPKPWHLIANCYDDTHIGQISADLVLSQNLGTKFAALHRILEDHPEWLGPYEYVLLLDDDILATEDAITQAFRLTQDEGLHLAQPSLDPDSASTWSVLLTRPASRWRPLSTVEIMMPLLSRDLLQMGSYLFGHSVSGWGLDFALGDLVSRHFGPGRVGVLDCVSLLHAKPIDVVQGAYYRMLHAHQISPLVEERAIRLTYGAKGPIREEVLP